MELVEQYQKTLKDFICEITADENIIAIILAGGLYHKQINKNSDINLIIIVQDDKIKDLIRTCIYQDVVFNIDIFSRTEIIQNLTNQTGEYDRYSYLSNNKIVFSRDQSLNEILNQVRAVKQDFFEKLIIIGISEILYYIREIEKWLEIKNDVIYAQYQFMKIAEKLTQIEYAANKKAYSLTPLADTYSLNKELFEFIYKQALTKEWTLEECYNAIKFLYTYIDGYINVLEKRIIKIFKIKDSEILTLNEICEHLEVYSPFLLLACDWLSTKGVITKLTIPCSLSKKGRVQVEQVAYFYNFL